MQALKIIFIICLTCFQTAICHGQEATIYKMKLANKMCSASITLLKGGNFVYEKDCEESSHVSFGKWRKTGNTIKLEPVDNKNFIIIRYFESGPPKDGHSSMKVLDIMGKDMTNKMKYTSLDTFHKEIFTTLNWSEAAQSAKHIRLTTLRNIFETAIDVDNTKPLSNILQLNIPENYIYNENSVWELPPVLEYFLESDCLVEKNAQGGKSGYYCPQVGHK